MTSRRSGRALRAAAHNKTPRRLAIEPLETRRLLASLTSQLPPIVISAGSEAVQIRPDADPTKEITLPSAAVSALEELASLQQIFLDLNVSRDDGGLLTGLQQDAWSRAEGLLQGETFERLELEAAVEIATQGFQLVSPPPELAAERIFGPSLSATKLVSQTNSASDASTSVAGHDAAATDTAQRDFAPTALNAPIVAAFSADDVSEAESIAESGADSHDTTRVAAEASHREGEIETAGIVARQAAGDEEDADPEHDADRAIKTRDMLLLPQPATGAAVPKGSQTDRPDAESPSSAEDFGSGVMHTGEPRLEQMLLLPMVPDSGMEHAHSGPTLIAGFNPVAMLQIFVGADLGMRYEEAQRLDHAPSSDREAEVASIPRVRHDRIAAAVFVIVVGYWYFRPAAEHTLLAAAGNPATDGRGAGGGMRKRTVRG